VGVSGARSWSRLPVFDSFRRKVPEFLTEYFLKRPLNTPTKGLSSAKRVPHQEWTGPNLDVGVAIMPNANVSGGRIWTRLGTTLNNASRCGPFATVSVMFRAQSRVRMQGRRPGLLSSEFGTHETVKARIWRWLEPVAGTRPQNISGKRPQKFFFSLGSGKAATCTERGRSWPRAGNETVAKLPMLEIPRRLLALFQCFRGQQMRNPRGRT